jgi:acetyltransferase
MTEDLLAAVAARRYPADAAEVRALAGGQPLLIRPMVARDAELMQDFVRSLSVHSRHQRFQSGLNELAPDLLARLMDIDYRRSMAFAAVLFEHGHKQMIGEARYAPALDGAGATDFAIAVADGWQRQGIGRLLFGHLLQYAARSGIAQLQGDVLHGNAAMLGLAREFGFHPQRHPDGAWLTRVQRSTGSLATPA